MAAIRDTPKIKKMQITVKQLAEIIGGTVEGNPEAVITTYSKIEEATEGSLSFISNPRYAHYLYSTQATAVLVSNDFTAEQDYSTTLIRVADPYATLARLLNIVDTMLRPKRSGVEQGAIIADDVNVPSDTYVGALTYIAKGVTIGAGTEIYPQCYIGENVKIGVNCLIHAGVKIGHDCIIGDNCVVQPGAVIGGDGFGFAPHDGQYMKIAQLGNVILEDFVEVGANTTIDRATMGSTIIRCGVKLDNLIQVAHNVEIGENTVMAAQVGVAGSTKIGKDNMVGGQVGFAGHIHVGDRNRFGAQSGVPNSVGDDNRLIGSPAIRDMDFARQVVYMKRIGELTKRVSDLEKEIKENKHI